MIKQSSQVTAASIPTAIASYTQALRLASFKGCETNLSVVKMAKASDFSILIKVVASDFHSSEDLELLVILQQLFLVGGSLLWDRDVEAVGITFWLRHI